MKERQSNELPFPGDKDPSEYFLTIHAHGHVKAVGKEDDHTSNVMMRGCYLPSDLEYLSTAISKVPTIHDSRVTGSDCGYSIGHTPKVSREVAALIFTNVPCEAKCFQPCVHYHIAFNEVGETIHDLHRLQNVFQCLVDVTIGAFPRQLSGWYIVLMSC